MTRNETIVAGRDAAGNWSAVLSGLWLRRDSRSSLHRLGSPGSPGGEEFFGVGIHTTGGQLAYEIARTALRRTRGLDSRLTELDVNTDWIPPSPTTTGTFSAALLQNIAPGADSPNLSLTPDPGTSVDPEFRREWITARHGRRDAIPVLTAALKSARDLIYLETAAFSFTDYQIGDCDNDPPNPETDLVSIIAKRMNDQPNLKVLLVVSKEFPVGIGYETFAARAYDRRKKALDNLKAIDEGQRVTLLHPIGFPGRPLRLMHNLVIIDDMWLFVGSGSFTRRGLLFDGNLSLVCFDRQIEAGRSQAIRNFRRRLMESHLGAAPIPGSTPPALPHSNLVRIADIDEAYYSARDLLEQGGPGLVQGLFDGIVTGQPVIPPESFPHRDLADPDGLTFPFTLASLLQVFTEFGEAEA
jgi:hypothetical protein